MNQKLKYLGLATVILNLLYITWLAANVTGLLGIMLFFSELAISSLSFLFLFNHWTQYHVKHSKNKARGSLDIFIPVVNESVNIIRTTVRAAKKIQYRNKKVYILDDGNRKLIKRLAKELKCEYVRRDNNLNFKAGNLNNTLNNHSSGEYILALDADQVVKPEIAQDLLGYFQKDKKLALITTRQKFSVPDNDFNHDKLFYEHMQTGKNADNAAVSCGSGVIYRRSAIESIGGFQTWNIVEDLFTTYTLHSKGFNSLYVNKSYTLGTAPTDLKTIYKQRGTWAYDTLRMFIYKSPLFLKGLSMKQRIHYIEISMAYVVSALAVPLVFLLPAATLFTGEHIIQNETLYLVFRLPSLISILFMYYFLSGRSFATSQFWASLWFVYLTSLLKSIFPQKSGYKVTSKTKPKKKIAIVYVLPHLLLLGINLYAIVWRILVVDHALTPFIAINAMWFMLMLFWFIPVLQKAFHFYPAIIASKVYSRLSENVDRLSLVFEYKLFTK